MKTMLPPLNALRAFEAVVRQTSFQRAADELSVTTSAVSHQIRNLEDFVGVSLLLRNGKDVTPTPEGDILFDHLTQAFALIQKGTAGVSASAAGVPLGISLRAHFAAQWLGPRMPFLWRHLPGLELRFFHNNGAADFSNPNLHVSIEWRHSDDVPEDAQLLWHGNLTPAIGRTEDAGCPLPETPAQLTDHKLLHETDDRSWREWLEAAGCKSLKARANLFYEDTNVRQDAAAAGEGFALVCPSLVKEDIDRGHLICPFDVHLDTYAYYLIVPPSRRRISAVTRFADWILKEAQSGAFGA